MVLDSTFDLDENIVCITLQEPSVSGDINSLFWIKIQVKNQKVNALFNNS